MSPKQKKIAAKAPPPDKIDAKDFAVLKAEKAKGRGMGLQDESVQPGKVMKARDGKAVKTDPTKTITDKGQFVKRRMKLTGSKLPGKIGTALGIASMMVPAAYAAAIQYKDYKAAKNRDEAKVKKMAGGMAKKYSVGGGADMSKVKTKKKNILDKFTDKLNKAGEAYKKLGGAGLNVLRGNTKGQPFPAKKMGGGMMNKPMGYKSGTMVKARGCKLGRNKPTKMY
jgi:hypothetical protein